MPSDEMQKEFLAAGGEKPKRAKAQPKRIRQVSDNQAENLETWKLIKQSMMFAQVRTFGHTVCMECKAQDPDPIDLDHIKGRAWIPVNAQLLCRPCHEHKHGTVQWSKP